MKPSKSIVPSALLTALAFSAWRALPEPPSTIADVLYVDADKGKVHGPIIVSSGGVVSLPDRVESAMVE